MAEMRVTERVISEEVHVLEVAGDLTPATVPACSDELTVAAAAMPNPGLLLVDLRGLDALTVAGVRMLRDFVDHTRRRGVTTGLLAGTGTPVERVLTETGGPDLAVYPSPDDAVIAYADVPADGDRAPADPELATVAERFARLTQELLGATSVADVLRQVITAAIGLVPAARLASVTLRGPDGELFTPTETDALATELDRIQYATGRGPCADTARPDGPGFVLSRNLREEKRWPEFSAATAEHGFNAVMSTELLPAPGPGRLSGALNIYAKDEQGLTETDQATALILATHGALALSAVHVRELAELDRHNLSQAVESRDVIGQAKGILMARRGLTADQAFGLLRRTSQDVNIKVSELAETLAARHTELDLPAEPASD